MYTRRSFWYPTLGKETDMRNLATEYAKDRQAHGLAIAVSTRAFSPIGSVLSVTTRTRDLAELEAIDLRHRTDSYYQTALAKANELSRAPSTAELRETIVPANLGSRPYKYVQFITIYPGLGKIAEVQAMLTAQVQADQVRYRVALLILPFGTEGTTFMVLFAADDLAEVESFLHERQANTEFQQFSARLASVSRHPSVRELYEIVVPFPAA
jgi:hypothetical protein